MTATRTSRVLPSLHKAGNALAGAGAQVALLDALPLSRSFEESMRASELYPLRPLRLDILQVNVGRKCNQSCRHCHVDAGPDRTETMSREVMEAALHFLQAERIPTLDITGGAPELFPHFRELVIRAADAGARVMHRCNLTAILLPNYRDIPALLASRNVEIMASLPYFQARETDTQRGSGVFEESIESLRWLNSLGYGTDGGLTLNLVANPVGTFLPGNQQALETHWKREMLRRYGVTFDHLYTLTNMPISRFLEFLDETGRTIEYMTRLVNAYNPAAAAGVMCRNTLSVGYDGTLFDCDFNQMLELPLDSSAPRTIFDADRASLEQRAIAVGPHCYGCTAGAGSSCQGVVA